MTVINKAIDQWLDRILLVIRGIGGHIEHRLKYVLTHFFNLPHSN